MPAPNPATVLSKRVSKLEEKVTELSVSGNGNAKGLTDLTVVLKDLIGDNEQGRKTLERMLGNIILNRVMMIIYGLLVTLPNWYQFVWKLVKGE